MTEFISRKYGNEGYEVIIKTDSHEHYKATEDFARRLIDHAKPVTDNNVGCKWIPAAEKLPDTFGTFIIAVRISTRERLYSDSADFDPFAKKWTPSLFWGKGLEVTHWMPLPEPPKEDV